MRKGNKKKFSTEPINLKEMRNFEEFLDEIALLLTHVEIEITKKHVISSQAVSFFFVEKQESDLIILQQ